ALAAPLIVPATALGRGGAVAPSERIAMACIGVGGRGQANLGAFHARKDVAIVAICDVDSAHRRAALERTGLKPDAGSNDFREVLARRDVDAVMVATPDHWHALISIAAVKAGKDVYCEKPLAGSIAEGQALVKAVREHKRVLQCGTQRRSMAGCRFACELVRNGRIGKLRRIEVGVPGQFAVSGGYTGLEPPGPVPEGFDYEMWLGPAPGAPYTAARCHFNFRWILDYSPGYITDWGAHYLDIAQWGNGSDESGPVEVEAHDVGFREKGIYDAPERFRIVYTYASGVQAVLTATTDRSLWGMKFVGESGSVSVESNDVVTEPASLKTTAIGPAEVRLRESSDHYGDFIECVRSRARTAAPVEVGHRSASICHLGAIAAVLKRKLRWDPAAERFLDDDEANRRTARKLREPWTLQAV
ncbi:MAG: Gfo/Idh/MocA family oxidoreductase, partial [Planctomycetes bacterium]|nr:Gfo/Idh/MocA family oxidoreductase [Planctomycetota bacterium]